MLFPKHNVDSTEHRTFMDQRSKRYQAGCATLTPKGGQRIDWIQEALKYAVAHREIHISHYMQQCRYYGLQVNRRCIMQNVNAWLNNPQQCDMDPIVTSTSRIDAHNGCWH